MNLETVELEVSVAELRVGMHVVRLDRPWTETDFLFQGFIIQSQQEIDSLAEQCRHVVIQGQVKRNENGYDQSDLPDRSQKTHFSRFSVGKRKKKPGKDRKENKYDPATARKVGRARISYINKVGVNQELNRATSQYDTAKSLAKDIMSGLRVGRAIDLNKAREVVDDCVDSVLRNDDALMLLTKLKHRDEYTAEHSINVSILAATFGKRLGLMEEEIRTLGLCGLLHDIGKAKVPAKILQKPGALTPDEHDIVRKHPDWGRDMLMALPRVVHATVDVAYNHHERLDGKGYPRGLKADQIPYFAKIMAIVDTYDAITSSRCYDKGRSSMEALEIIHRFRGTQFDPDLAREFVLMIGIYPPGSLVEMTNGEAGVVIAANPNNKRRPKIILVRDADKKRPEKYRTVDMSLAVTDRTGEKYRIAKEIPDGTHGIVLQRLIDEGLVMGHQTVDELSGQ